MNRPWLRPTVKRSTKGDPSWPQSAPLNGTIWDWRGSVAGDTLIAVFVIGWLLVLISTFMISHFKLFGLTQAWRNARGRPMPQGSFKVILLYRIVRHPIMLGFVIAFWSSPVMTYGHLLFASLTTAYILVGIQLEERDLLASFGSGNARYRESVPMLLPFGRRSRAGTQVSLVQMPCGFLWEGCLGRKRTYLA